MRYTKVVKKNEWELPEIRRISMEFIIIVVVLLLLVLLASCIKIVPQANSYVIERLGAYHASWDVGLHIKIPFIERVVKTEVRKENKIS